jgi:aldose 1-epimerase
MSPFLTVTNESGACLTLSTFGARLVGLTMPDRDGVLGDVVLGFDTPAGYREHVDTYMGATIGRVAGRTANAHFVGGGLDLALTPNNGPHTLHGGSVESWDRVGWEAEEVADSRGRGIRFTFVSPADSEGYPGTVRATSTYLLSDDNELTCEMRAVADAPTPVAMTQHAYWNLTSGGSGTVVDNELWIASHNRVGMTDELVPTGDIVSVEGTGFDFTQSRRIGALLPSDTGVPWPGIDHTYLLDGRTSAQPLARPLSRPLARPRDVESSSAQAVAIMYSPSTGRRLELLTTEPALQVYLGCHLSGVAGRGGASYAAGNGMCLETVRFPDSPLLPDMPSIVLAAGEEFVQESVYRFSVS